MSSDGVRLTIRVLFLLLLSSASTGAQDVPPQKFRLDGVDFSFSVMKTPEGKDYGYFLSRSRWPRSPDGSTVVYVCWENYRSAFSDEHRLVEDAVAATWQAQSKLQFKGWRPCAARSSGIRISVDDAGPHTKGLGSDLDGKPSGMVLNFTFENWSPECRASKEERLLCIKSIAVHEFGHAIGFAHEHNRPDKPGECKEAPQGTSLGAAMLTPYDPSSVMNYCNKIYNNDGILSPLDIQALQIKYGKR